jgi:trans-aconitate methyltransferase
MIQATDTVSMTQPVVPTTPNTWQADRYLQHAAFVPALARDLVGWLAPQRGERILDLGCGDGVLTMDLVAAGADVIGIDASPSMIAAARARGIDARLCAAERLAFGPEFDAAFSNAMLHWTRDIDAVLAGVFRALRPGGRFIGEFGGAGNIAIFLDATEAVLARRGLAFVQPWYFPTTAEFSESLARAGFAVRRSHHFARPTALPAGIVEWIDVFGGPLLAGVSEAARAEVARDVEHALESRLRQDDGTWMLDYTRLRFDAQKPGVLGNQVS